MDKNLYKETSYRNDIQGVRAIGAILVMIYHIWFGKVSGGVDVFFVVSGYFMSGMLARSYFRSNKVKPFEFWGRIITRIAPLAYTVIAATFLAGYFFNPPSLWRSSVNEILTSALHVENWNLIRVGADYLDGTNPPSPLQQFWALSLQIQLYIILPVVLFFSVTLSKIVGSYKAVLFVVGFIIVSSFGFSIYYTGVNPAAAYFHTGARAWEFFVGVAIYIASPFISLSVTVSRVLMWLGFLLILVVGVFVPDSAKFPGYIAALPVTAAAMMIIAGISDKAGNLYKFLSSKVLVYIGGMSFSLYLWHWPILVYFRHHSGVMPGEMTLIAGLMVIALAFTMAAISKNLIENPFAKVKEKDLLVSYIVGLTFFIPVLGSSYYARTELVSMDEYTEKADYVAGNYYEGESAAVQRGQSGIEFKRMVTLKGDITDASLHGCSEGSVKGGISSCEFGDKSSETSVLLVGGSRMAHWEPLFTYMGRKDGFKVVTATMDRCSFGYHPMQESNPNCRDWNKKIMGFIANLKPRPKVVIVSSSRLGVDGEFTPREYISNIKNVLSLGIPVVGIRINPKFNNPDVCLWRNSDDVSRCAAIASLSLANKNPVFEFQKDGGLENFYPVDFTNVICNKGMCPAVINGHPAMRDAYHFTDTYISYMAPALEKALNAQSGGFSKILTTEGITNY
jgi:peptidoglycan/LPS O-acetylase OafA/YrhL